MAIDEIHLEFEYNFFTNSCLAKSYTRTTFCVCRVNQNCYHTLTTGTWTIVHNGFAESWKDDTIMDGKMDIQTLDSKGSDRTVDK